MERPRTQYVDTGEVTVAYCRGGEGPVDLVVVPGFATHLELMWEPPFSGRMFDRAARFARVTQIDKRGVGLSDHIAMPATFEQRADDLRAVMDAEGIERAAIVGVSDGGTMSALFAATYPERVSSLVLWSLGLGRASTVAERSALLQWVQDSWGSGLCLSTLMRVDTAADVERLAKLERYSMSPRMARALLAMDLTGTSRAALPAISAPTLVIHRHGDPIVRPEAAAALADLIPGARRVELPGDWHFSLVGGDEDDALDLVEEFVTGTRPTATTDADRVLATVMFTDIVDSTRHAEALGDRRWRDLLDAHDHASAVEVDRHRGVMVKTTGDGVLARFDGPVRAIQCGCAIVDAAGRLGLQVRAGLHAGAFLLHGDDLAGVTVHIGARVAALAGPGEVYVSSAVRDIATGSGVDFDERGRHALKGVSDEWEVLAVTSCP